MPPPDFDASVIMPPDSPMLPTDIPTNHEPPQSVPFDFEAYRARKAQEEAAELARLRALPEAHHKAEIIEAMHKALLPAGFAMRPLADLRMQMFAELVEMVCAEASLS